MFSTKLFCDFRHYPYYFYVPRNSHVTYPRLRTTALLHKCLRIHHGWTNAVQGRRTRVPEGQLLLLFEENNFNLFNYLIKEIQRFSKAKKTIREKWWEMAVWHVGA